MPLGNGSRPHGGIVGPDGHAWVTDGRLNAIVRVQASTHEVTRDPLPGASRPYAVFVDDRDLVWISYFGTSALVAFDPRTEQFTSLPVPSAGARVRQLLGRPGELWGAESGTDISWW